ncbi:MAG: cell division ATP-binding protein FtsE [Calditrichia bacterium]|nr:cell division ATP-binding protein FtsE [Calditrichia bacterium]
MIEFFNVTLSYKNEFLLKDITFKINKGDFVYLTGRSGVGKSSILKLIYFDEFPDSGNVTVNNFSSSQIMINEIPVLRRTIGVIFQDYKLLPDRNVFENVAFALRVTGAKSKEIRKKTVRVLTEVGMGHKRNQYPPQLSGGEQQLTAIARALINNPFVLLADEPTGNLDSRASNQIMNILEKINHRGTAVLMASHNLNIIKQYPHRRLNLENGAIKEV